jgi:LysR family transcriptional regulator for metE and metH
VLEICSSEDIVVAGRRHPWGKRQFVEAKDFGDETLFAHLRSPNGWPPDLRRFARKARRIQVVEFTDVIVEMVSRGLGVAILPRWVLRAYGTTLASYRLSAGGTWRSWWLALGPSLVGDPLTTRLLSLLRSVLGKRSSTQ